MVLTSSDVDAATRLAAKNDVNLLSPEETEALARLSGFGANLNKIEAT